jgi:hypothetical protein
MKDATPISMIHPDPDMFRIHQPNAGSNESDSLKQRIERARKRVQPIIDRERRNEPVDQKTMDFLMR